MRLHFTSENTDIISHFSLLFLNTNSQFSYAIKRKLHSGVKIKTIFFSTAVLIISSCYCVIPSIHLRSFMPKEFVLNINKKKMLWILKLQVDLPSVGVFVIWSVIWKFHDWLLRKKKSSLFIYLLFWKKRPSCKSRWLLGNIINYFTLA